MVGSKLPDPARVSLFVPLDPFEIGLVGVLVSLALPVVHSRLFGGSRQSGVFESVAHEFVSLNQPGSLFVHPPSARALGPTGRVPRKVQYCRVRIILGNAVEGVDARIKTPFFVELFLLFFSTARYQGIIRCAILLRGFEKVRVPIQHQAVLALEISDDASGVRIDGISPASLDDGPIVKDVVSHARRNEFHVGVDRRQARLFHVLSVVQVVDRKMSAHSAFEIVVDGRAPRFGHVHDKDW